MYHKITLFPILFTLPQIFTIILLRIKPHTFSFKTALGKEKRLIDMRTIQFKMERQGLVTEGQEVEITDHEADSGSCYIIEPAVAMSGCYKGRDRLKSTHGIVKEIQHNDRGYYVIVEFDE